MELIGQFLLSSLPWITGTFVAMGSALLIRTEHGSFTTTILIAGVGGPIGYLIFAAILNLGVGVTFFDYDNLRFFKILSAITLVGLLCLFLVDLKSTIGRELNSDVRFPPIFLAVLLIGLVIAVSCCILWLPAIGYDVLDHWAPKAQQLIMQLRADSAGELLNNHRHPNTLKLVLAWTAWTAEATETNTFLLLPWALITLSLQLVLFSFAVLVSRSVSLGLFVALGAITTPLMENHIFLAGYAELPIALFLSSSCAFIAVGMLKDRLEYQIFGVILAMAILFLKGSGVLFALLPVISLLLTYSREGSHNHRILLVCLTVGSLSILAFSVVFEVNGNLWGFDGHRLRVFGWRTGLTDVSILEISRNLVHAYFINSSFSVLPLAFAVLFVLMPRRYGRSEFFLMVAISLGLIFLATTQLTSYGLRHARVGFDTGNSRFSMPVLTMFWLLAPFMAKVVRKPYVTLPRAA